MQAGDLRHRVTIQARADTSDGHAGFTEGVTTICARVPASIQPLMGLELERAMQIDPRSTHHLTMRFRSDVKARHIVVFHDGATDRTFEIIGSPTDTDEMHREMTLLCKEQN
jgi:SPP1 family predicted phage head-tail adaptor